MNVSKKVLIAILVIAILGTALTMAAIFVPAVGEWFSSFSGPFGSGIINLFQMPLKAALEGGAQTIAFWGIIAIIVFGFAYWVWHWDIGYKISGATAPAVEQAFSNTTKREPDEPELSPTAKEV
jgi:hypothetical protein